MPGPGPEHAGRQQLLGHCQSRRHILRDRDENPTQSAVFRRFRPRLGGPVSASDIRATPVTIETMPGVRTTSLTLINEEQKPVRVQVRVMRWTQENEADVLTPTQDVVASPPQTTLAPGQHYLIRLVRTARAAPVGEEAYRVIVDEISDPANAVPGAVNLVLRQEIPAFFSDEPRSSIGNSRRRTGASG